MAKLTGATAYATTYYTAGSGSPPNLAIDGKSNTRWESNSTGGDAIKEVFVLGFAQPVTPKQIRLLLGTWGPDLRIGYSHEGGTVKANYTEIKGITFASEPNDSRGNPWVYGPSGADLNTQNVILLPDNQIAAKFWGIWFTSTTGIDRVRIWEISMYDTVGDEGANPTLPTVLPTSPFLSTPVGWKRTEYSTVGQFTHVPESATKLMLIAAQGAGAGGFVNLNLDGSVAPATAFQGGDAVVATAAGNVLIAPGAVSYTAAEASLQYSGKTEFDWINYADFATRSSSRIAAGNDAGAAGGLADIGGVAGVAYKLTPQITNSGMGATNNFRTADAAVPVTLQNFTRGSADGYRSDAVAVGTECLLEMTFNAYAGQVITVSYGKGGSSTSFGTVNVYVNDQLLASDASSYLGGKSVAYTVTQNGPVTVKQTCTRTGSNAAAYVYLSAVLITGVGQGGSFGGASGRQSRVVMAPATLSLTVPKGGIGQPAGQTLTSEHSGTRGSGGSSGGNGGDGVIVVYEYQGFMAYSEPADYSLANYNVATNPLPGVYRTDYVGRGIASKQNYVHKLRPSTKNVLVLMSGCGGGNAQLINAVLPEIYSDPAIVSTNQKTFTAGSGVSSPRELSGGYIWSRPGKVGEFSSNSETIWQSNGVANQYFSSGLGIFSNYGYSRAGQYTGTNTSTVYSGGSGAAAFFMLTEADIVDRTINIQVPGQGDAGGTPQAYGYPGVVVIYETESIPSLKVTQLVEQILMKDVVPSTYVTQTPELMLKKDGAANTQVTQTPELILVKEGEQNNSLQVSYANVGFIVEAGDPETWITQTSEQLLVKQGSTNTQVTQSAEMILARTPRIPYRMTQLAELVFVSEIPSVFWLNFGEVADPVKDRMYTSLTGRATSVQPGAYIQLEGPIAKGTTMFVNDVDVGLSSPIANNDRVRIVGGIPNWWQPSINVYTYYLTNGEVTREQVGMWLFKHPVRVPTKPRAYSMTTSPRWILVKSYSSTATILSIFTKARIAVHNLNALASSSYSRIGPVVGTLIVKLNAAKYSMGQKVSQSYHAMAKDSLGPVVSQSYHALSKAFDAVMASAQISQFIQDDFIPTKNYFGQNVVTFDSGIGVGAAYYEMTVEQLQASYGLTAQNSSLEVASPGAALLENAAFLEAAVGYSDVDQEYNAVPQGTVVPVDQDFDYVPVGKSYSDTQEYEAMITTGFASTFTMGFTDTIAYSVLGSSDYTRYLSGNTGVWDVSMYIVRPKMTLAQMFPAERSFGHTELVGKTAEVHSAHEFHNFRTTPIYAGAVGVSTYQTGIVKRVEKVVQVQINWVRVKAQMGVYKNTPYRPAQIATGRGKASLYMGFDTTADAKDFTANYSGVKILQKFNGYVYNLDVDKTFVCEIYYNGPISGLIQGG